VNSEVPQQAVADEGTEADILKERVSELEELLRDSTTAMSTATATLATMQTNFADEKAVWESERTQLISSNKLLISERASFQKDVAFFRELYGAASAHVDTLNSDKLALEKRTQELTELLSIAENQVHSEFAGVKAFFEWRVGALEGEVEKWKELYNIFQEKEIRAGNLIRNTVEEAEGLRNKVKKLKGKLKGLKREKEAQNVILESRSRRSRDAALAQILPGDVDSNGKDEEIYRCVWMPAGGNANERCEQLFVDIKVRFLPIGHVFMAITLS
jgi:chromosome segregation ATPase